MNLQTQSLSTQRRIIDALQGSSGDDVVAAARQRLAQTQANIQHQQQLAAQRQLMATMRKQQRELSLSRQPVLDPLIAQPGDFRKPVSSMPQGNVRDWIAEAIRLTPNTRMRLAPGIYNMIMHESGGNPRAINNWDSNAKAGTPSIGLMQTIQPTFNAYAMKGHKNIYNPVDNIIAGLRYALSRYGHRMVRQGGRHDAYGNYIGY